MLKFTVLVFGLISVFACLFTLSLAQEAVPLSPSASPSPLEYPLPYPGILPDHPLFFFKIIRDQILLILITNPVRKVEFQILLSDKYLNMAVFAADEQKQKLTLETSTKSIVYLRKAEKLLFQIPAEKKVEAGNLKHRFEKSLQKHQEVITDLINYQQLQTHQDELRQLQQDLSQIFLEYSRKK